MPRSQSGEIIQIDIVFYTHILIDLYTYIHACIHRWNQRFQVKICVCEEFSRYTYTYIYTYIGELFCTHAAPKLEVTNTAFAKR